MAEMSPLAKILMVILRNASFGAVGLLLIFLAIFLWQHLGQDGHLNMTRQDWGFLGVLVAMLAFAIYLIRSIAKEIKNASE